MTEAARIREWDAFERNPKSLEAFTRLKETLIASKRWQELIELFEKAAAKADPRRRDKLLFEAAEHAETRLKDPDVAARLYEGSFLARKRNLKAIRALRALEESRENWKGVLRAHELHLKILKDKTRRVRLLQDMGHLYETVGDHGKAFETFRKVLELDPSAREVLARLERSSQNTKKWRLLIRTYKTLAQRLKGKIEESDYHFRAGRVFEEQLKDVRNAAVAYTFALNAGLMDIASLERIMSFAEAHDKKGLLDRVLKLGLKGSKKQSGRVTFRLRVAEMMSHSSDPEALESAKTEALAILELKPRSKSAHELLSAVYQKRDPGAEAWARLHSHELEHLEPSPKRQSEVLVLLGEARERLGDDAGAAKAFEDAVEVDEGHLPALSGLMRMARNQQRWDDYEKYASLQLSSLKPETRSEDRVTAVDILRSLAWMYRDVHVDTNREMDLLHKALSFVPGDQDLLNRLLVLSDQAGEQAEWARLLEQQASLTANPSQRHELYRRLAQFREEALEDRRGAAEAWEMVDQYEPSDNDALSNLERLYTELDDHKNLASVYRRQSERSEDQRHKSQALRKLGAHYRDKLKTKRRAMRVLREAWTLDPNAAETIDQLEELLELAEDDEDLSQRSHILYEMLHRERDQDRLIAIRLELAAAYESLKRVRDAQSLLADVLSDNPLHEEALEQIVTLLVRAREGDKALPYLLNAFQASEGDKAFELARRMTEVCETELDAPNRSTPLKTWKTLAHRHSENKEALSEYLRFARLEKSTEDLILALGALADISAPEEEAHLLVELARIHREQDNYEDARHLLRKAHFLAPSNQDILDQRRSILALIGAHSELANLLESAAEKLSEERISNRHEMERVRNLQMAAAEVAEYNLNAPGRAILVLEAARRQQRSFRKDGRLESFDRAVLEKLAELYRTAGEFSKLEGVLGVLVESSTDKDERVAVIQEQARVAEQTLSDPASALASYDKAIAETPSNSDLWLARAAVHERLGSWGKAVADLARAIDLSGVRKAGLAAIEMRRALIFRDHLRDDEGTEKSLKRAVKACPEEPENHQALIDFYERRAMYPQLQECLAEAAEHTDDLEETARLLRRRAEILARFMNRLEPALQAVDEVLKLQPGKVEGLDLKIRILRRADRPEALAQALELRRQTLAPDADTETRVRLLREEGLLQCLSLGNIESGRRLLQKALELQPHDETLLNDLILLERRAEDPERLVSLLVQSAEQLAKEEAESDAESGAESGAESQDSESAESDAPDASQRESSKRKQSRRYQEAGLVALQQLKNPSQARRLFELAQSVWPDNEGLHWLQWVAEESGDQETLMATLEWQIERTQDPERLRDLTLRLGQCQIANNDLAGAQESFEASLKLGSQRALRGLVEIAERRKDPVALCETSFRMIDADPLAERKRVRLFQLADKLRQLDQNDLAVRCYRKILKADDKDEQAMQELVGLLTAKDHADEIIELTQALIDLPIGNSRKHQWRVSLATLYLEQKEQPETAKELLTQVIDDNFAHLEARQLIKQCYIELHDWPSLAALYKKVSEQAVLPADKEEAARQAALIYHHHLNDLDAARELYFVVLELGDPQCLAIDVLPSLVDRSDSSVESRRLLTLTAQIVPGSGRARQSLLQLAEDKLKHDQRDDARVYLVKALGWSPEDFEVQERVLSVEQQQALEKLIELEREDEHWAQLCSFLLLKAKTSESVEAQRAAFQENAQITREKLKNDREALQVYEQLFELTPEDPATVNTLCLLYKEYGPVSDWLAMLTTAIDKAKTDELRHEFLGIRVSIHEDGQDWRAAVEDLRRMAQIKPESEETLRKLAEYQERLHDDIRLLITLDELAALQSGLAKLRTMQRKAALLAASLERPNEACEVLEGALELSASLSSDGQEFADSLKSLQQELLEAVKGLADSLDDQRRLRKALEFELSLMLKQLRGQDETEVQERSPEALKALEQLAARVARMSVVNDEPNMAEAWLERCLKVSPSSQSLFHSLRTVIEASGRELRLFDTLEQRCEVSDRYEQASLRADIADLLETQLKNPEAAQKQWQQVLDLFPASFSALRSIQRIAWTRQDRECAIEHIERELEILERLGPVPWTQDPKPDDQRPAPGDIEDILLAAFKDQERDAKHFDCKALVVDTVGFRKQDLEALVAILARDELPSSDESRPRLPLPEPFGQYVSRMYRKAAIVAWDMNQLERAARFLERALFLTPNDEVVRLHLAEVHEFRKDWESLLKVLRDLWCRVTGSSERVNLGLRIAEVEEKLDRTDAAIDVLETIWPECQGDQRVLKQLKALQDKTQQPRALAQTLLWEASLTEQLDEEAQLRFQRAEVLEDQLEDVDGAIDEYERVLSLQPAHVGSRKRLTRRLTQRGSHRRLVGHLESAARSTEDAQESARLYFEAGAVVRDKLFENSRALQLFEAAREQDSAHSQALDALIELYREEDRRSELIASLSARAQSPETVDPGKDYIEAADFLTEHWPERATVLLERCLDDSRVHPEDINTAGQKLLALLEQSADDKRLLKALVDRLKRGWIDPYDPAKDQVIERTVELAHKLGSTQKPQAIEALETTLNERPQDTKTLEALIELLDHRPARRLTLLDQFLDCELTDEQRLRAHSRVVEIASTIIYDPQKALSSLQYLREHKPDDTEALNLQLSILEREQQHFDALEVLGAEISKLEGEDAGAVQSIPLSLRKVRILEEILFNIERAEFELKALFQSLTDDVPDALRDQVFEAYESFLRRRGRFEGLVEVLDKRVDSAIQRDDKKAALKALHEQAIIYEGKLQQPKSTVECFERALSLDPKNLDSLLGIRRPLRVLKDWAKLDTILAQAITVDEDLERCSWLSTERGLILEEELARLKDAVACYEAALAAHEQAVVPQRRLLRLYERMDQPKDAARVLEQLVKSLSHARAQGAMLVRLGELYRDQLKDYSKAGDAFQRAVKLDPSHVVALEALIELLRDEEQHKELASQLGSLVAAHPDARRRREALRERAQILEQQLGDQASAARCWAALLEETPGDEQALSSQLRCYFELKDWSALADGVEFVLARSADSFEDKSYPWLWDAARALQAIAEKNDDPDARRKALECASVAAKLRPKNEECVQLLLELAPKVRAETSLIEALKAHAEAVDDLSKRAEWLHRAGVFAQENNLGDKAKDCFLEAVKAQSDHRASLHGLEQAALNNNELSEAVQWLEAQLDACPPEDSAELYHRLAKLQLQLGDTSAAIHSYLLALDIEADDARQLTIIHESLPTLRALERWHDCSLVLKRGAELTASIKPQAKQRATWLKERADILVDQLHRLDLAADIYEQLMSAPLPPKQQDSTFSRLIKTLEDLGEFRRLQKILLTETSLRGDDSAPIWIKLGQLALGPFANAREAVSRFQQALILKPSSSQALKGLKTALVELEDWPEALECLDLIAAQGSDVSVYDARMEQGEVALTELFAPDRAEAYFDTASRVAVDDESRERALVKRTEALEQLGDERALFEVCDARLKLQRGGLDEGPLLKRMGRLAWSAFRDAERAISLSSEALGLMPEDMELLELLTKLYEHAGRDTELVTLLKTRADRAVTDDESVRLFLELARAYDRMGEMDKAWTLGLEPALKKRPHDASLLRYKADLLRLAGRREECVKTLQQLLEHSAESADKIEALQELIGLLRALGRDDEALTPLRALVDSAHITIEGLRFVVDVARSLKAWDELSRSLQALAQSEQSAVQCAILFAEVGWIELQERRSLEGSMSAFEMALQSDKNCAPALRGLSHILSMDPTRSEERLKVIDQLVEVETAPQEKVEALLIGAAIAHGELEDPDGARKRFEHAMLINSACYPALVGLAELCYDLSKWEDADNYFQGVMRCREFGQDRGHAADLMYKCGRSKAELELTEEAVMCFRRALEFRPDHRLSQAAIVDVMLETGQWQVAISMLEPMIARCPDPEERVGYELSLAAACKEMGEVDRSLSIYRQVANRFPNKADGQLNLGQLLIQRGDVDGARRCMENVVAAPGVESAKRGQALIELAEMALTHYQNSQQAVLYFRAAIDQKGSHRAHAASRLAEMYALSEQWQEAAQCLTRAIELESDPYECAKLWAHLGRLSRDRLASPDFARQCFENSLELNPEDVKTIDSLIRLLRDLNDHEALNVLLQDAIALSGDAFTAASFRVERAQLLWKKLGRSREATREFELVLNADPRSDEARRALARLYVELGDGPKALSFHRKLLKSNPLRIGSYRAVTEVYRGTNQEDGYVQGLQVLALFKKANARELTLVQKSLKTRRAMTGVSEQEFFNNVLHEHVPASLARIMNLLSDWSPKLFPVDLRSYKLKKRHRIQFDGEDRFPEQHLLDKVMHLYQLHDKVDAYWMPDWRRPEIVVEASKRPTIMLCPAVFESLNDQQILYLLGKNLGLAALGASMVPKVGRSGLYRFLKLVAQALAPDMPLSQSDSGGQIQAALRALGRELQSESSRRAVPLINELWNRRNQIDFARVCTAYELTANRCGLLAAGGVMPAVECIFKTNVLFDGQLGMTTEAVKDQFRDNELIIDLLRYAVSEDYLELRELTGLV